MFLTPTHLGVVTEYAREGDLRGLLARGKPLTEGKARFLLQQLVSAVAYCHCEARHDPTLCSRPLPAGCHRDAQQRPTPFVPCVGLPCMERQPTVPA